MTVLHLLWLHVRVGVLQELTYRGNLGVQLLSSALGLAASFGFLGAVFTHGQEVAGWRAAELVALWGVFYLLSGLLGAVVQPSLNRFIEDIRHGALDFTLLKPVDAQALVSVKHVEVWRLVDAAIGVTLLVASLFQLGRQLSLPGAALFGASLLAGGAIVYSCCLLLASLAFWFVRVENALIVFLSFWDAGRWPVAVYPPWLRATLTVLIPVAFATAVPAEALAGRLEPWTAGAAAALAVVLLALSRWVWTRGIRSYSGASA